MWRTFVNSYPTLDVTHELVKGEYTTRAPIILQVALSRDEDKDEEGIGTGGSVVEEDMVILQANDDFVMGALSGTPGAIIIDTTMGIGLDENVWRQVHLHHLQERFWTKEEHLELVLQIYRGQQYTCFHGRLSTPLSSSSSSSSERSDDSQKACISWRGFFTLAAPGAGISSASTSRPVSVARDDSEPVASVVF
ncbi:hypothetical protein JOM56_013696 [Amanita muscaria]